MSAPLALSGKQNGGQIVNFAFSIHAMTSQQLTYLVQNLYHDVAYEQACATRHGQRTPMIMQITFRHFMLFFFTPNTTPVSSKLLKTYIILKDDERDVIMSLFYCCSCPCC